MLLEGYSSELSVQKSENQGFQDIHGGINCLPHKDLAKTSMPKMEQPVSVTTADKDPELEELNTGTREQDGKASLTLSQG